MIDREILIEKYLNGELSATESKDLLAKLQHDVSAVGLRDELSWESAIRSGLARDAEALPSFATVPNAQLLSGLTAHAVTEGLLSTLGGKAMLYLGGALIVGAAVYLAPKLTTHSPAVAPMSAPPTMNTLVLPTQQRPALEPIVTPPPQPATVPVTKHTAKAIANAKSELPHTLKLDDADDKNAPVKTDKGYQPPVK